MKRYHFHVTKKERGDYTTPHGTPEVVYAGPNPVDAMAAACEAADQGGQIVQMTVEPRPNKDQA